MLKNPQGLDYETAMKMYEEQPLQVKKVTAKDRNRLRRLKRKSKEDEKEMATSIKIEEQGQVFVENLES